MERIIAKSKKASAPSARDPLRAVRTWSITLGISALLLTAMYAAAAMHYGPPHFSDPESVIAELAR